MGVFLIVDLWLNSELQKTVRKYCIQNVLLHMSSWTPDPPTITIYNNNDLNQS